MAAQEIHLEAVSEDAAASSRTSKQAPSAFVCYRNLEFAYSASPDGVDTNLLILLHGRGDNEQPFARLGRSLALPQTATLALKGPQVVPLLDEHEREWWAETDMLGMEVRNPDPGFAIKMLCDVLQELVAAPYSWTSESIHLFGFGQGGSLAYETGQSFFKRTGNSLGSIVSVHGPLLSLPSAPNNKASTPVLYVTRSTGPTKHQQQVSALERGFTRVQVTKLGGKQGEIGMPRNTEEWQPIMEFWSEVLRRKNAWELNNAGEQIYEVKSGKESVPLPGSIQSVGSSSSAGHAPPSAAGTAQRPSSSTIVSQTVPAMQTDTVRKPAAISGMRRGFFSQAL